MIQKVGKGYVCSEHIPCSYEWYGIQRNLASYPGSSPAERWGGEEPGYKANGIIKATCMCIWTNKVLWSMPMHKSACFDLSPQSNS